MPAVTVWLRYRHGLVPCSGSWFGTSWLFTQPPMRRMRICFTDVFSCFFPSAKNMRQLMSWCACIVVLRTAPDQVDICSLYAQYTPPTRRNCRVSSRRRCEHTRRQSWDSWPIGCNIVNSVTFASPNPSAVVSNSCTHRRRGATKQFRLVGVGGVYWALHCRQHGQVPGTCCHLLSELCRRYSLRFDGRPEA